MVTSGKVQEDNEKIIKGDNKRNLKVKSGKVQGATKEKKMTKGKIQGDNK